jgi:hypothetical protein
LNLGAAIGTQGSGVDCPRWCVVGYPCDISIVEAITLVSVTEHPQKLKTNAPRLVLKCIKREAATSEFITFLVRVLKNTGSLLIDT